MFPASLTKMMTAMVVLDNNPDLSATVTITDEMLADKPHFADVADELIDFIRGSELLIHNAKFDSAFLDKEWDLLKLNEHTKDMCKIVDTVELARKEGEGDLSLEYWRNEHRRFFQAEGSYSLPGRLRQEGTDFLIYLLPDDEKSRRRGAEGISRRNRYDSFI